MQEVATGLLKKALALLGLGKKVLLIIGPHQVIIRIYPIPAARLGVFRLDEPDGRQFHIHLIIDLDADDIMLFSRHFQCIFKLLFTDGLFICILLDKIAQEENNALMPGAAVEEADGFPEIGTLSSGLRRQQPPDDIKHVLPTLLGWY